MLTRNVVKVKLGAGSDQPDVLALEEPLEIQVSPASEPDREWKTLAITMRTPGHDRELAAGFLRGEGLLKSRADIEAIYSCGSRYGAGWQNCVRLALGARAEFDPARFERHFYMSSSCGVCGKTSLDALGDFPALADAGWQIDEELIRALPARLREAQDVFDQTGGLHAAGLFTRDGVPMLVREDVGRHNAVDKIVGAQFLAGTIRLDDHVLVVSGRASFELVQKAIVSGVPMLVAVGAPSSLAVELAEKFGLTLIGFTKPGGFNIYTGAQRVRYAAAHAVVPDALPA
jgi:FdhD protein